MSPLSKSSCPNIWASFSDLTPLICVSNHLVIAEPENMAPASSQEKYKIHIVKWQLVCHTLPDPDIAQLFK